MAKIGSVLASVLFLWRNSITRLLFRRKLPHFSQALKASLLSCFLMLSPYWRTPLYKIFKTIPFSLTSLFLHPSKRFKTNKTTQLSQSQFCDSGDVKQEQDQVKEQAFERIRRALALVLIQATGGSSGPTIPLTVVLLGVGTTVRKALYNYFYGSKHESSSALSKHGNHSAPLRPFRRQHSFTEQEDPPSSLDNEMDSPDSSGEGLGRRYGERRVGSVGSLSGNGSAESTDVEDYVSRRIRAYLNDPQRYQRALKRVASTPAAMMDMYVSDIWYLATLMTWSNYTHTYIIQLSFHFLFNFLLVRSRQWRDSSKARHDLYVCGLSSFILMFTYHETPQFYQPGYAAFLHAINGPSIPVLNLYNNPNQPNHPKNMYLHNNYLRIALGCWYNVNVMIMCRYTLGNGSIPASGRLDNPSSHPLPFVFSLFSPSLISLRAHHSNNPNKPSKHDMPYMMFRAGAEVPPRPPVDKHISHTSLSRQQTLL